jgi:hypothetical protein
MAQLNVTQLDFEEIKQSLKTFMRAQDEFRDYDFEGSALSVLLDTLAYNTHYNAVLAHMVANESFLDSAIKRNSVVSIAKSLGYTPRSARAATAYVDFSVVPSSTYNKTNFTLSRNTAFESKNGDTSFIFYPDSDVTSALETVDGVDKFVFTSLPIREGSRVSNRFFIDLNILSGPLTIPNDGVDTSTLRVRVQKSTSDLTIETYSLSTGVLDLKTTTSAYFLEEGHDGKYIIRFGDGVFGKKLETGNIVIIDYLVSSGADANGAKGFQVGATLTGGSDEVQSFVTANTLKASGGAARESIDSIRKTAPIYNQVRERAVSATDYRSLILAENPNIQSCSVWGGENNDPPIYGKVFISLDPVEGQIITDALKDQIINTLISPRAPVAILPEFVTPEYTYIGLRVGIVYDASRTSLTSGQITQAANDAITNHFSTNLNQLNKNFYYSQVHNAVKVVSNSIISVNITPTLQKRITAVIGLNINYNFTFNSRIQPRELHSNWANIIVSGTTYKVKFQDTPNSEVVPPAYSGTGIVSIVDASGTKIANVGTIDYSTGAVSLNGITVVSLYGTDTQLKFRTRPHDDSKDILTSTLTRQSAVSTAAVVAKPAKNTILTLDDSVINTTTGSRKGVEIVATTEVEGY